MRDYDLVIIGAGPGGYETALEAAGTYGMKTALIEKEALGGTCLNHGCIPTKTLLHSADLYRQMKECERFGLHVEGVSFDLGKIQDRKSEVLDTLRSGIAMLMKQKKVDVIEGTGKILDSHTVEITRKIADSHKTKEIGKNVDSHDAKEIGKNVDFHNTKETGKNVDSHNAKESGKNVDPYNAETTENNCESITLSTEHIIIATGSVASMPPIPGADLPGVVTSDELLEKRDLPDHLLIIGGGVIGMEFASVYSAFGTKVTVLEALPKIIANMDKELSQSLKMLMKKRGVTICTGARVEEIRRGSAAANNETSVEEKHKASAGEDCERSVEENCKVFEGDNCKGSVEENCKIFEGDNCKSSAEEDGKTSSEKVLLECVYTEKDKPHTIQADCILICTGRRPNTTGLFGPDITITTERGRILTDEDGQTNVPNIYAIGDATGGIMLAHAATAMGRNALAHINHVQPPVRADIIPACIYTDPEIASVGLTTEQAGNLGIDADSRKVVMSANGKTVLSAQERGFIKVVFEKETHKILGAQMMCARASDMISEFAEAIVHGLTTEQMFSVVRPHPTFCEAITDACR